MMPYLISMLMRHPLIITALLLAALILSAGCTQSVQENTVTNPTGIQTMTTPEQPQKTVRLETNMGNITIALSPDMPITAGNFESLTKKGYYDGVIFHRIIDGFMI